MPPCTLDHQKGGRPPKPPLHPHLWARPTPTLCEEPALLPPRAVSRGTGHLFLLPHAAAGPPVKPCLNFLSGLSQFLLIKEGQETWPS